ncbi:MAG: hypothetical protein FJ088_16425, partial [Deltaproteobacteria bacterium]|nr:hypothetical protein [Deltaproteobacteria bacterium]
MHKLVAVGLAAMLLMPVVVGAQGAISTLPDPGTLPDSPFYFLKSWRESIQLFFTFDAEKKAEQYLHLAEVRLAEYEKMVEKALRPAQGESAERTQAKYEQIAERTLEKYEDQLGRALAKVEELKAKSEEKAIEVKAKAEETTSKHLQVLQENLTKVPETAREGIKKALEASRKGIERVRWAPRNDETTAVEASQLIPEDEVVEGELVGYYTSITRTAFESTETCDVFTIIGGNPRLRGHFARLIEIGNTINSKNANGEIMLNLNFQTV